MDISLYFYPTLEEFIFFQSYSQVRLRNHGVPPHFLFLKIIKVEQLTKAFNTNLWLYTVTLIEIMIYLGGSTSHFLWSSQKTGHLE